MSPPTHIDAPSEGRRRRLFARTALCGALCGVSGLAPASAIAAPQGGIPEVNAGGGNPVITTTGLRTDVTLNAQRTVLNWTGFDVTPDETVSFNFGARNWIVLNRIGSLSGSKIEGTIEGRVGGAFGGNVWFVSNSSIIFGRSAQVDVGGLLVGIGSLNTSAFLDPANNLFSFNGGDNIPATRVFVLSGAQITAHGGSATFAGPSVVTRSGSSITAADGSVTYGGARNYQIRFAPGVGGDFDLVDFIIPDAGSGTDSLVALDLAGDTRANAVFVAAVNRSAVGSAIINLEGMMTATAAKADGGDVVLSGGGGIANRGLGPALSDAGSADMFLARATASRDLKVSNMGRIFPRPWFRPPEEAKDPLPLGEEEPACIPSRTVVCDDDGPPPNGMAPLDSMEPLDSVVLDRALVASLLDPTATSSINSGRDTRIAATASIELGRIVSGRDLDVKGASVKANGLVASGDLTAAATEGDVLLAGVGALRGGAISAKADIRIDAITATQKLTVTSGRDISLGDGVSTVTGPISLNAPNNVFVDAGSAKIDSITAGVGVNLRGGALDVAAVTAPKVFAQAASVKLGSVSTSGDLYVIGTNGDAIVGSATAGDDIFVLATHGTASLGDATLTGNSPDALGLEFVGNPDAASNGRVVRVESSDLDAKLGLSTGGVTGATAVTVRGGRDAIVEVTRETPGAVSVVAARDATLRAPTVRLDSVTAGRDLAVGSTTGDFTLTNSLTAVRNITVTAAGALRLGDVRADAGSVVLTGGTIQAGNVSASEDLTLRATTGGVTTTSYRTGRDLILQGTTLSLGTAIAPVARDLSITSLGDFTSSAPLSAGRNVTIDVAGKATLGQTTGAGVVRIAAGDLDLTGAITAPTVQIESRGGALRVGGAAGGGGFVLDNNDFGQLRASGQLKIYAGLTTGGARGDLTLQDLAVNTANTPNVTFLVGSGNNALVTGTAAPTTAGGILRIGDATDLNWRPNSILLTGGLGAATFANGQYTNIRAFNEVRLAARQDILMGSQRFITLIQGTAPENIDLAKLIPAGVAPQGDELLKVYVSAGRLEVSADNKVVQQNAAPSGSQQSVGLLFTGQFSPALIIDPPKVVELWGAFAGANGQVLTGPQANGALTFTVVDTNGNPTTKPDGANYRFNSCDVGTSNCAATGGLGDGLGGDGGTGGIGSGAADGGLRMRDTLGNGDDGDLTEEGLADAISSESLTSPPVLLGVAPPDSDEIVTDPVAAGTGSEEIWRKRRQKK
jgi:filamentous hemagglutinin family protein